MGSEDADSSISRGSSPLTPPIDILRCRDEFAQTTIVHRNSISVMVSISTSISISINERLVGRESYPEVVSFMFRNAKATNTLGKYETAVPEKAMKKLWRKIGRAHV